MDRYRFVIFLGMLAGAVSIGPALAQADTITVDLAGEKYNDLPKFAVTIGDVLIGEGTVGKALDTVDGGSFAKAEDPGKLVESFSFPVPEGVLTPTSIIDVTLLNDAYDATTKADINLYLAGASVNGETADMDAVLLTNEERASLPVAFNRDMISIYSKGIAARITPPSGGWTVNTAAAEEPVTAEEPGAAEEPTTVEETEPPQTAEVSPAEPAVVACSYSGTLDVTGFDNGGTALSDGGKAELDRLVADLSDQGCTIEVTGYSSNAGPRGANQTYSESRAAAVLAYLEEAGVVTSSATSRGEGETSQFGAPAANRRVVVVVNP